MNRFMLLLGSLLLATVSIVYADVSCGGEHCLYYPDQGNLVTGNVISHPTIDINFTPSAVIADPSVSGGITYVVKTGAIMSLNDISTVITRCVDGAVGRGFVAVRVVEVKPDGSRLELPPHYSISPAEVCYCGKGSPNFVGGNAQDFNAFTFSNTGLYHFSVEYATTINASSWAQYADFNVMAGPGRIAVDAPDSNSIGVKNNAYEKEEYSPRKVFWNIRNAGDFDVNILSIKDLGCDNLKPDYYLKDCIFPLFPAGGVKIPAGGNYLLREDFNAYLPSVSPTLETLGIDVAYSDPYGINTANMTSGEDAPDQRVSYKVQAMAMYPYVKTGTFSVKAGQTYYAQVCTDSPKYGLYSEPLFAMEIYDTTAPGYDAVNSGHEVTAARFHEVGSCAPATKVLYPFLRGYAGQAMYKYNPDLNLVNDEGGLVKFTPTQDGTYTWKLAGIVGFNDPNGSIVGPNDPLAGNYYKSDFAVVGTDFNNETQLVDHLVLPEQHLGPQLFIASAPIPVQSATVNAYERTKLLGGGPYTLTPSTVFGYGTLAGPPDPSATSPSYYALTDVTINSSDGRTTAYKWPSTSVSDGNTTVWVVSSTSQNIGTVYTGTDYVLHLTGLEPPKKDVNILWVDKEKYMFEYNAGSAGICRDMQGNIRQQGGSAALSGTGAAPHVKYDWNPAGISASECDTTTEDGKENTGYAVCDSAQFTIELLKKLDHINQLYTQGKASEAANENRAFYSYLMRDGFSTGFQQDFDRYFRKFFSTELNYESLTSPWSKYLSDNTRFTFSSGSDNANTLEGNKVGRTPHEPGIYKVDLVFTFDNAQQRGFFDAKGDPTARINVMFNKAGTLAPNLLYSLPIDAQLGMTLHKGVDRQGYGTGFTGEVVPVSSKGPASDQVSTDTMSDDSNPLAVLNVRYIDTFADATKNNAGQVLLITKDKSSSQPNHYSMSFSDGYPVPTVLKAEPSIVKRPGGNSSATVSYSVSENQAPINAGSYLARLAEISYQLTGKDACTDTQSKKKLPYYIGQDRQAASYANEASCDLSISSPDASKVYGFNRDTTSVDDKSANIYLETVFYPVASHSASITNACASQGKIYLATLGDDGSVSGYTELDAGANKTLAFDKPASGIGSLADAINAISSDRACIAYGTTKIGASISPDSIGVWWNEARYLQDLRGKLSDQTAPNLPVNACMAG